MADADRGLVFDADNLKVGEYLDRWLSDSVSDTVKATTFERYEQITRLHLKPALGLVKLKGITPAHVRGLYREKLEAGSSARTVRYVHTTLHKALKQAVMDGLIPRNATEAVKPPQPSREEMHPLSPRSRPSTCSRRRTRPGTGSRPSTCWRYTPASARGSYSA
jgi:integrase